MPAHIGELPKALHAEEILQEVLKHYVGVLSPTELARVDEWWGTKQAPEAIIFCTNSTRKIIMFALLAKMMMDLSRGIKIKVEDYFPHTADKPHNIWLAENVANGDGALKIGTPTLFAVIHGVQLWVQPTTGESEKNDQPFIEAAAKAIHGRTELLKHLPHELEGKRLVLVSADTVEHVTLPNGERKSHGKPVKEQQYPHQYPSESPIEYANRIEEFNTRYIQEGYPVGAEVEHIVAVAFFGLVSQTLQSDKMNFGVLQTRYTVVPGMLDKVKIDPYAGGAGITQQIEEIFKGMNDVERIALLCQIMGAPLMPILEMIKSALPERGVDQFLDSE